MRSLSSRTICGYVGNNAFHGPEVKESSSDARFNYCTGLAAVAVGLAPTRNPTFAFAGSSAQQGFGVLVFDKESVVDNGPHRELYEENGLYRQLYDRQAAGATL